MQLPLTEYTWSKENPVDRAFFGRVQIEKCLVLLYYSERGIVKNIVHAFKYRKQEEVGRFLGKWMGEELLRQGQSPGFSTVIPVPLHPSKRRKRGYNQAAIFGQAIARTLDVNFDPTFLTRSYSRKSQTRKGRLERWESQRGLYRPRKTAADPGDHVLLVDDVITTGATLEACASQILNACVTKVSVAAIAFVP